MALKIFLNLMAYDPSLGKTSEEFLAYFFLARSARYEKLTIRNAIPFEYFRMINMSFSN